MSGGPTDARCPGCMEPAQGGSACPHCGWRSGAQHEDYPLALLPGTVLANRYLVGRVLGQGGFGITYLGWDPVLSRRKAIKECFPQGIAGRHSGSAEVFATSPGVKDSLRHDVDGFLNEARLVASFENHPNIVWIQDFFSANGTAYMIIEYLHGQTLEQHVEAQGGRIPWQEAGRVLISVLDALKEVHRVGVLHRDVSPDNVFLQRNGQIKLIDFGAARATASAASGGLSVILKHGYGPLEQYQQNGNQGPWTDVYAAAGTIYRTITGTTPPAAPERYLAECLQPPSLLGVAIPPAHEQALLKAMAVRVEHRFQDVVSFQKALLEPLTNPAPSPSPRPAPTPKLAASPRPAAPPLPSPAPSPIAGPTPPPTPTPLPNPVPTPRIPWKLLAGAFVVLMVLVLVVLATIRVLRGDPPEIAAFEASTKTVLKGRTVTLRWEVNGASEVEIVGVGKQPPTGAVEVRPAESGSYKLRARAADGSVSERELQVSVTAPVEPRVLSFGVTPNEVDVGDNATLAWNVADAAEVKINNVAVNDSGSLPFQAKEDLVFRLYAKSAEGGEASSEARLRVRVRDPFQIKVPAPTVRRFGFSSTLVAPGERTTLTWDVDGATSVRLQGINNIDSVKPQGSLNLTFRQNGTVTLVASNTGGTTTRSASVTVRSANPASAPQIVSFQIYPPVVDAGLNCQLSWSTRGASRVSIAGVGDGLNPQGSRVVRPQRSGDYVLTAYGPAGATTTARVSVQVRNWNGMQEQQTPETKRWAVIHDLGGALNFGSRNWNHQRGVLTLTNGRLRFETQNAGDNFDVAVSQLTEVGTNMLPIQGRPAFHVKLPSGRNYNFLPQDNVNTVVNAIKSAVR